MQFRKSKLTHLFLAVLFIALLFAIFVERRSVTGESSTESPDGNWHLNLRLIEFSTVFRNRKILDANLEHSSNKDLYVKTSIPLNYADAKTISNQLSSHPVVWSDDSTTVNYWINKEHEDWLKIEVNESGKRFQRGLNSTSVFTPFKKQ